MRALLTLFAVVALPAVAAGINDTGVTTCFIPTLFPGACDASNSGDAASYPRQDARFGRDAAQAAGKLPPKTGGGVAGFDFTPLDASGNPIALTGGVPASPPSCVRDNITGLTWEVKTTSGLRNTANRYTWHNGSTGSSGLDYCAGTLAGYPGLCTTHNYVSAVNAAGLCGTSNWRMPSRRELRTILNMGGSIPFVDNNYFPNTAGGKHWSGDAMVTYPNSLAWEVNFGDGSTAIDQMYTSSFSGYYVRLVR